MTSRDFSNHGAHDNMKNSSDEEKESTQRPRTSSGRHNHGRSDEISALTSTFIDPPLEARYIKNTAASFRELRFCALTFVFVAAVFINVFLTHIPPTPSTPGWHNGVSGWGVWVNAPLNLSLSLFVVGLYSLEPRKSTIRMQTLQQITSGLVIIVTACLIYSACSALRGDVGAGAARLHRALELNIGGWLFIVASTTLCDTIAVPSTAVVATIWGIGWVVALHGVGSWGFRAGAWCLAQAVVLLGCKWILENSRRQRWLHMLRLEGELRSLGEMHCSASGKRNAIDESSDGGSRNGLRSTLPSVFPVFSNR